MNRQLHVHFNGNVQGVGFRWTARNMARHYPVSGYARNMPDGSVEMLVQGDESDILAFVRAVESEMGRLILSKKEAWSDPVEKFDGFGIRF